LRSRAFTLISLSIILGQATLPNKIPLLAADFFQPVLPARSVQFIIHRGVRQAAPENTLPAIQLAIDQGFEWVEVDVRLTKDGHHVIFHDRRLNNKSNGSGRVKERMLQEIKALDGGSWFAKRFAGTKILTLEELLRYAKKKINLYLDCKEVDPESLVQAIRAAQMEDQVVVFSSSKMLGQINQSGLGKIPLIPLYRMYGENYLDTLIQQFRPAAIEFEAGEITPALIGRCHKAGVRVLAKDLGGKDRTKLWNRLIDLGVDWIMTDVGEGVLSAYTQRLIPRRPIKIVAQRGVGLLAPENTRKAYERAINLGLDFIEVDVRTSRDGRLVLFHDRTLESKSSGAGPLELFDLEELVQLDFGSWFGQPYENEKIMTFREVLELAKGKIQIYANSREADPKQLVRELRQEDMADQVVVLADKKSFATLRAIQPELRVMPRLRSHEPLKELRNLRPYAVEAAWTLVSPELIRESHESGIKVFANATGRDEKTGGVGEYVQAIEWGIDAIQTTYPTRIFRALEIWKLRQEGRSKDSLRPTY
jgi:glycerophosphoryl diester phosphodiesterase